MKNDKSEDNSASEVILEDTKYYSGFRFSRVEEIYNRRR